VSVITVNDSDMSKIWACLQIFQSLIGSGLVSYSLCCLNLGLLEFLASKPGQM